MKLKEFEKVQELIGNYRELKKLIADVKFYLKADTLYISDFARFFNRFPLTKEETNMILSRLENELLGLKNEIKELGVDINNGN